jgi:hypothetical protein
MGETAAQTVTRSAPPANTPMKINALIVLMVLGASKGLMRVVPHAEALVHGHAHIAMTENKKIARTAYQVLMGALLI